MWLVSVWGTGRLVWILIHNLSWHYADGTRANKTSPYRFLIKSYKHKCTRAHTRLTALFPGLPGWAGTRKVKPIWILLKQETMRWHWHQVDSNKTVVTFHSNVHSVAHKFWNYCYMFYNYKHKYFTLLLNTPGIFIQQHTLDIKLRHDNILIVEMPFL